MLITPDMLPLIALKQLEIDRIVATVPGGAANVQDIYPLAPLQEGILFHHLMAPKGDIYLLRTLLAFDERARVDDFVAAFEIVTERHDILRTGIVWESLSQAVQVVWRRAALPVEENQLAADTDAAEQLLARFNPQHYRLDVRQAPMMRVFVTHDVANNRWLLLLIHHHLVDDNISVDQRQKSFIRIYWGRRTRPAMPFRNFIAHARLGVSAQEHEVFFRDLLGDVVEPTISFGLRGVQADDTALMDARFGLDPGLARRLRARARALEVSPASLFHYAWAQVLARISGRQDVVFGTVLFGRMQVGGDADRALGVFINTLPVRIQLGDASVEDGVRSTHRLLTGLLRHEHAPLALAQRCSALAPSVPLFNAPSELSTYRGGAEAGGSYGLERDQARYGANELPADTVSR